MHALAFIVDQVQIRFQAYNGELVQAAYRAAQCRTTYRYCCATAFDLANIAQSGTSYKVALIRHSCRHSS
jgi:hypothetical protein